MPKKINTKKEQIKWAISCDAPTPLAFYRFIKPTHHLRADEKYRNTLILALKRAKKNEEMKKKIRAILKKFDDGECKQDWEIWKQEKRAIRVHNSIQEVNANVHKKFNTLVENQSIIVGAVGNQEDVRPRINSDVIVNDERPKIGNSDVAVAEYFDDLKNRNIFILCEPFRNLSKVEADDRFETIACNTFVETDIPNYIKEYLINILSGDIESTLSKVEKPLGNDTRPLLLWTREICRHFILYYRYGGLQTKGNEKTWSTQTIYRVFDLFSMFFRELISGISFGEAVNENHKDRIYDVNADQKPPNSHRGDRNDAVIFQDERAVVLYEQSFGPTGFDEIHYLGDMTKLARNGVDDINHQFLQYPNSSTTTAKRLKSISIHGHKYVISIYLTDLVSRKTYRFYEIFNCRIPVSYTDRWFLMDVVKIGVILEELLVERKSAKEKLCEEHMISERGHNCVFDWISIPDNTPDKRTK